MENTADFDIEVDVDADSWWKIKSCPRPMCFSQYLNMVVTMPGKLVDKAFVNLALLIDSQNTNNQGGWGHNNWGQIVCGLLV